MKPQALHQSPWRTSLPHRDATPSTSPSSEADVVVVGAGISGLTTAVLLAEAGRKVVVLDMGAALGSGDTGSSTAHLTVLMDSGYQELTQNFGRDAAATTRRLHQEAIEQIARFAQDDAVHCDWQQMPGLLYAESQKDNQKIAQEADALAALDGVLVQRGSGPLPFARGDSLRVEAQGCIDPKAYLEVLACKAQDAGAAVHLKLRMTGYEKGKDCVTVHTAQGDIRAQDVVFATHTPPTILALQTKLTPMRTYALAAEVADMPEPGLYFDTFDPYHYLRPHTHNGKTVLIAGGCDHRVGADEDTRPYPQRLEEWVRQRFDVRAVTHQWSGQVFEPTDGLPFLGLLPGEEHLYVITGLSGNGLTSGTVGARLCAESILGHAPAWAAIFTPGRIKPIAMATEFVKHQTEVTAHLVGDRVKAWLTSHVLAPGEGAVMREGTHTAAVYNDGSTLHTLSPVCPHAGCYVKWNSSETSWDCPCHGSRFNATGKLLCGPATSDLTRID